MKLRAIITNQLAFQCAWFACVLGAAAGQPLIGLLVVLAVLAWHLYSAHSPWRELQLIAIAAVLGALFETLLIASGLVRMQPQLLLSGVTPLWMVALWAAFASTLNVSLRGLRQRPVLCAALAAIGAPLAYAAGARLGALQWVDAVRALALVGLGWAVLTPLLLKSARRFDGYATP